MDFALYSLAIVVRSDCCVPIGFSNRDAKCGVGLIFRDIRLTQREFVDSLQSCATGFVEPFDTVPTSVEIFRHFKNPSTLP